ENIRLYAISIDTPEESRNFLENIAADGNGSVKFDLLSDPGHRVIDGYGLRDHDYDGQKFEGLPHPSIYLIDKNGRVAWAKIEDDYQKRPTKDELRAAIDSLTSKSN
ncbi:MAG: redoxin domain-containing protein, partial [Pyrinomonadaceae bacterium]